MWLLPGQRPAVAARVGAGEQHAGRRVATDDLDAARPVEVADGADRVAAAREIVAHSPRESGARWSARLAPSCGQLAYWPGTFEVQRGISAACCGSRPKSIIAVSTCRLTCTWWSAPGVPKTHHNAPSFSTIGGFIVWRTRRPGREPVRMAGFEMPIGHAVVEQDAGVAGDHPGAETAVDALDARDRVALAVGGAEIGRVAGGGSRSRRSRRGAAHVDAVGKRRRCTRPTAAGPAARSTERGSAPQRSRSAKASFFASTMA